MKLKLTELRRVINEELMAGVPEHQFRTATSEFVDSVRQLLRRNILLDKSKDSATRQQAFVAADRALKDLEKEVFESVQDALYKYNSNT